MTRTAIGERDWRAATSFLEIEVRSAEVVGNHALRADVLLRRALVHLQLRDAAAARDDVRLAQAVETDIGDAALRTRLQADRGFVEAMLASFHPGAGAIEELSRAIEFHRHEGRRMLLPQMLLLRSRARRAGGDMTGAWADLESAASELEQQRESLPQGDIRAGIFDTAREVFEDAVDMQLARGDAASALHYAERGRARVLLDAVTGGARDVPRDDDGWKRSVATATAGLSFVSLRDALYIFIVDRHGVSVARSSSPFETVRSDAEAFATAVAADDESAMQRTGRALYEGLIAPVQDRLGGVQHLLISGESDLLVVPFSALTDPRTERYLIEDFSVVTTPTIAAYERFSRLAERRRSTARLLAVGDPRRNDGTPRLAASEDEVRAVERLYRQSVVMTGPDATREAFVQAAATANVIHFAGHGIGDGLRAKLLFATAPGDDGQMYASELSSLAMPDVSVAVLAACSTGQGRRTAEGVWSIGRSFLRAGVPSVVAALWPLEDEQAPRLFTRFHEHLVRGARSSDALRATQLELLREKGRVRPSLWAALQVIGS